MRRQLFRTACAAAVIGPALAGATVADPAAANGLPKTIAVTAYETTSSGHAQAVAMGSAFKNNLGVTLRVLPGKNDLSRLVPVREGKADFSANGIGTYMAQEAVFEFAHPDWGPQPLRVLAMSIGDYCLIPYAGGDTGVKTAADLKGLRLSIIRAAPALNYNLYVYLRFADLDWKDVQLVEFPGGSAAGDAIVNNQADVAFGTTITGNVRKLEASPRGVAFPAVPHDDAAGWKRFLAAGPYYVKHLCTEGVGISKDKPVEGATYPYPILIAYADKDAGTVYAMTKAVHDQYPNFRDSAPGAAGWAKDKQRLDWVVPFHEGAIRFYKEAGMWTDAHQSANDRSIERQAVLRAAWDAYAGKAKGGDEQAFLAGWKTARAAALRDAGHYVVWADW